MINNFKDRWEMMIDKGEIEEGMEDVMEYLNGKSNHGKEREDLWNYLTSSGFQFTWTKSPKNPMGGILKRLDRVMSNEELIGAYGQYHAVFFPNIISNHCPFMIVIPNGLKKNVRSFRFANYIVDKPEFIPTIEKEWKLNMMGF
ncbi:RNA-directed DNA polymerase, eukaryota, reverse transcriptase zinc-binding domain protein [Tanacetum coccineum]